MTFSLTPNHVMMHPYRAVAQDHSRGQTQSPCTMLSPNRRKEHRVAHLLAGRTGTEAVGALGDLLGGDGNDVDGDRVELEQLAFRMDVIRG
jgi:hypothetical protein